VERSVSLTFSTTRKYRAKGRGWKGKLN